MVSSSNRPPFEEKQGRELQKLLELAVRVGKVGIWELHANGDLYVHPVLRDLLGQTGNACPGSMEEYLLNVSSADRHRARDEVNKLRNGASERIQTIRRMRHADGTERLFLCRTVALPARAGEPRPVVGVEIVLPFGGTDDGKDGKEKDG